MTPQQFATAIGIVESNGNPNAPIGDAGRAVGRFQMHPDFMWDWGIRLGIRPQVNETLDSFQERLAQAHYSFHSAQNLTDIQCAMCFHEGRIVREGDPSWDEGYALRFTNMAGTLV